MEHRTKMEKLRAARGYRKKKAETLEKGKLGLNQILKPALYLLISIILEIMSFAIFDFKTASGSKQILPQYILFDVGVWLFVSGLIICSKKNWLSNIFFYIAVVVKVTIFIINVTLKADFGYLFTFDKARLLPEMVESMNTSFINYPLIAIAVIGAFIVIALPIVFDNVLGKKKIQLRKMSNAIFCLLLFLITATVGFGCYTAQTALIKTSNAYEEITDDKYLYKNQQIHDLAFQKFGSCGFYIKNLTNLLFPNSGISQEEIDSTITAYDNSAVDRDITASLYGDNLIVIMLESFEWFAIDPYNTPNLWALKTGTPSENISKQGVVFSNYQSNNKTNVSENISMLGYMPNEATFVVDSNNVYATKYSIPNLLKAEGYTTSFFHNWKINFYNRDEVNKNIGFDNIYSLNDFEHSEKSEKFNFYNRETDFANQLMNKIAPTTGKFMSFYTTVSSHGTYTVQNPRFEEYFKTYDNNLELMKTWFADEGYAFPSDKEYQAILKEYKSACMDTDEMIGNLFKHLNDTGLIQNTTVVIYSDHNAYYQNLTKKIKGTEKAGYESQKAYNVPMIIYSNKIESQTIDSFCSTYDIYPTLCNMFGLPYNVVNAMGKDMLSEKEIANTIYSSALTGFYSPKCYSKTMQYITRYEGATDADEELFKINVCEFLEKQQILNIVYKSNRTY